MGTVVVSGEVTVSGTVTVTGTVAISGTVTISGSVTVTGTVTISGAVTITSGAVTISTSGGTNILVDKLLQGAYVERRSIISNHGGSVSWYAPTGNNREGKFFPRGCRGFITSIDLYCKDAGAAGGTITVYLAPFMGAAYVYSGTVTIGAGATEAWVNADIKKMWKYDSLFIWTLSSTSDMQIAYDSGPDDDEWVSIDAEVSWARGLNRFWMRVIHEAETVGDLPISGWVNAYSIEGGFGAEKVHYEGTVVAGEIKYLVDFVGEGTFIAAALLASGTVAAEVSGEKLFLRVQIDDHYVFSATPFLAYDSADGFYLRAGSGFPMESWVYDTVLGKYGIRFNPSVPIPFRRHLQVYITNEGDQTHTIQRSVAWYNRL